MIHHTLRVLHLEDDPNDVELVGETLRAAELNCEIEWIRCEDDLRSALQSGPVDVVLSDHAMPSFDSHAALRILTAEAPDVPFILVTGMMGEEAAIETMRAGATDYVLKDKLADLPRAVTRAVEEASLRRQRLAAEIRLRESERRFRTVFENGPVPMATFAMGTRLLRVNDAFRELLELGEAEPAPFSLDRTVAGPGREKLSGRLNELLRGERDTVHSSLRLTTTRDSLRCVDLFASRLHPSDEGGSEGIAMLVDVTAPRRLEEQLRHSQKMEAIGRLAGGVAHDFNNVLSVIVGFGDLLLSDPSLGDDHREQVREMVEAGERAAAITRQLLAFGRKEVLEPRVFELEGLIRTTGTLIRRLIGEDVRFETALSASVSRIRADPGHLEQILMNLAINARDAMPRGGTLTVATEPVRITPDGPDNPERLPAGAYVRLIVRDTGEGMDEEARSMAFEPFFTTKGERGSGLGLATVYGIVRQNRGDIRVHSAPGRGAEFHVRLPRVDEPVDDDGPPDEVGNGRGDETVLVVEDEPAIRLLIRTALEQAGYRVLLAADGEEAVRLATSSGEAIDLVLTDVVLPGMNGRDVAHRLREQRPEIEVVFMSGYTDNVIAHRGMLDPGTVLIHKPFTPTELRGRIRRVLDSRGGGRSPAA